MAVLYSRDRRDQGQRQGAKTGGRDKRQRQGTEKIDRHLLLTSPYKRI
jgi:hypothetical protein